MNKIKSDSFRLSGKNNKIMNSTEGKIIPFRRKTKVKNQEESGQKESSNDAQVAVILGLFLLAIGGLVYLLTNKGRKAPKKSFTVVRS
jgi:hypothetical protein